MSDASGNQACSKGGGGISCWSESQGSKKGHTAKRIGFVRIATADMVLWDDTRIVHCDSQLWAIQYTWSTKQMNMLQRLGSLLLCQISTIYAVKGHCSLTKILVM